MKKLALLALFASTFCAYSSEKEAMATLRNGKQVPLALVERVKQNIYTAEEAVCFLKGMLKDELVGKQKEIFNAVRSRLSITEQTSEQEQSIVVKIVQNSLNITADGLYMLQYPCNTIPQTIQPKKPSFWGIPLEWLGIKTRQQISLSTQSIAPQKRILFQTKNS